MTSSWSTSYDFLAFGGKSGADQGAELSDELFEVAGGRLKGLTFTG